MTASNKVYRKQDKDKERKASERWIRLIVEPIVKSMEEVPPVYTLLKENSTFKKAKKTGK